MSSNSFAQRGPEQGPLSLDRIIIEYIHFSNQKPIEALSRICIVVSNSRLCYVDIQLGNTYITNCSPLGPINKPHSQRNRYFAADKLFHLYGAGYILNTYTPCLVYTLGVDRRTAFWRISYGVTMKSLHPQVLTLLIVFQWHIRRLRFR